MRKEAKKQDESTQKQKAKEEAKWVDNDPAIAKKIAKQREEEEKRELALKNKEEKQKLLEEEEKSIEAAKVKKA